MNIYIIKNISLLEILYFKTCEDKYCNELIIKKMYVIISIIVEIKIFNFLLNDINIIFLM